MLVGKTSQGRRFWWAGNWLWFHLITSDQLLGAAPCIHFISNHDRFNPMLPPGHGTFFYSCHSTTEPMQTVFLKIFKNSLKENECHFFWSKITRYFVFCQNYESTEQSGQTNKSLFRLCPMLYNMKLFPFVKWPSLTVNLKFMRQILKLWRRILLFSC